MQWMISISGEWRTKQRRMKEKKKRMKMEEQKNESAEYIFCFGVRFEKG